MQKILSNSFKGSCASPPKLTLTNDVKTEWHWEEMPRGNRERERHGIDKNVTKEMTLRGDVVRRLALSNDIKRVTEVSVSRDVMRQLILSKDVKRREKLQ